MVDIRTYINAMVQYYGLIPHEKAAEIHQIHFGRPMDPSIFEMDFGGDCDDDDDENGSEFWEDNLADEDPIHNHYGLFYSDQIFVEPEHRAEIIRQKLAEPWYIPELDAMLRFGDGDYVEDNEALQALDRFIRQHGPKKLRQPADTFAPLIGNFLRHQFDIPLILDEVREYGLKFTSKSEKMKFIQLIQDLADHTHQWNLNGFSPKAFREAGGAPSVESDEG